MPTGASALAAQATAQSRSSVVGRVLARQGDAEVPVLEARVVLTPVGALQQLAESVLTPEGYGFADVPAGEYTVCVVPLPETYFSQCVGGDAQFTTGAAPDGPPVVVTGGDTALALPDLVLTAQGSIAGSLAFEGLPAGQEPPAVTVTLLGRDGTAVGAPRPADPESPDYGVGAVPPGEWTLHFAVANGETGTRYASQHWGGSATLDGATFLTVAEGEHLADLDVVLQPEAEVRTSTVSGPVWGKTPFGNTDLSGVTVELVDRAGTVLATTASGDSSSATQWQSLYSFADVAPGEYTLHFLPETADDDYYTWRPEWLGNVLEFEAAEFFTVTGDGEPVLQSVVLDRAGNTISGRVLGLRGEERVPGVAGTVQAVQVDGSWSESAQVDADGVFTFYGVPAGDYQVCAPQAWEEPSWFGRCVGGGPYPPVDFEPVTVEAGGEVTVPDILLAPTASVSGALTVEDIGSLSEPFVYVTAHDRSGETVGETSSHSEFVRYTIHALPPGEYTLQFRVVNEEYDADYRDHWWGGATSFEDAEFFTVEEGQRLTGFDHRAERDTSHPYATARPQISGSPLLGQTLTASLGEWSVPTDSATCSYRWLRDGEPIEGADGADYEVTLADLGSDLSVEVRVEKDGREGVAASVGLAVLQIRSKVGLTLSQDGRQEYGSSERIRLTSQVRNLDGSPAEGTVIFYSGEAWGSWGWTEVARVPVVDGVAAYRLHRTHAVGVTTYRAVYRPEQSSVRSSTSPEVKVIVTKAALQLEALGTPPSADKAASVHVRATTAVAWPQGTIQIKRGSQVIAQQKVFGTMRGEVTIPLPADVVDLEGLTAHYLGSSVVKRGSTPVLLPVPPEG